MASSKLEKAANVGNEGYLNSPMSKDSLAKTTIPPVDQNIPQGNSNSLKAAMKILSRMHNGKK